MVPVPIAVGFLVALILRELYIRQGGTFETEKTQKKQEETTTDTEDQTTENIDDTEEQQAENPESTEISSPSEENPSDTVAPQESEENTESDAVTEPKSIFDNPIPVSTDLRIDNVIEDMLDDVNPIVPADLSSRLSEMTVPENTYEENEDDHWFNQEEDDIMQRLNAVAEKQQISFPAEQNDESDISSMAAELLGKDFDFNALKNSMHHSTEDILEKKTKNTENAADVSDPLMENSENDVYQTDSITASSTVFSECLSTELKSETYEIMPVFPANLISDAVIEPETAGQFCFSEELRPMFVPKHKTRKT